MLSSTPAFLFGLLWWTSLLYCTFSYAWPRPFDDWKNGILYIGAALFFIDQLVHRLREGPLRVGWVAVLLLLYFLTASLSMIGAGIPRYEGFLEMSRLFLWAGLVWSFSRLEEREWMALISWSVILAAAIVLFNALAGVSEYGWRHSLIIIPIGHSSYYGDFMALHAPLAFLLVWQHRRSRFLSLFSLCLLLILWGVWNANARSSLVGLLVAFIFCLSVLLAMGSLRWKKAVFVFLLLISLGVTFYKLEDYGIGKGQRLIRRFATFTSIQSEDDLNRVSSNRWFAWKSSWRMIEVHPLKGFGLGSFRFFYPEYSLQKPSSFRWYMHPHNELLHQWVETGWMGLLIFLSLGFVFFQKGFRASRQEGKKHQLEVIMILSGLVMVFVSWQFNTSYLFPLTRLLVAFYLGRILSLSSDENNLCRVSSKWSLCLGVLACLAMILLGAHHVSLYMTEKMNETPFPEEQESWADRAYHLAPGAFDPLNAYVSILLSQGHLEEALPAVESLHKNYPFVPVALFQTAMARMMSGQESEARELLQHALVNDPHFEMAKQWMDQLEKTPRN